MVIAMEFVNTPFLASLRSRSLSFALACFPWQCVYKDARMRVCVCSISTSHVLLLSLLHSIGRGEVLSFKE